MYGCHIYSVLASYFEIRETKARGVRTLVKYSRRELESTPPVLSTITAEDVAVPVPAVLEAMDAKEMPVPDPPPVPAVGAAVANGGTDPVARLAVDILLRSASALNEFALLRGEISFCLDQSRRSGGALRLRAALRQSCRWFAGDAEAAVERLGRER